MRRTTNEAVELLVGELLGIKRMKVDEHHLPAAGVPGGEVLPVQEDGVDERLAPSAVLARKMYVCADAPHFGAVGLEPKRDQFEGPFLQRKKTLAPPFPVDDLNNTATPTPVAAGLPTTAAPDAAVTSELEMDEEMEALMRETRPVSKALTRYERSKLKRTTELADQAFQKKCRVAPNHTFQIEDGPRWTVVRLEATHVLMNYSYLGGLETKLMKTEVEIATNGEK